MSYGWLTFGGLSLVVCLAGSRVTYYGDVLGEKWSVARTFIGVILLSTITSLPELVTTIASVTLVDAPDLAVGNVLGSNLFNLFLLPLLAVVYGAPFLHRASFHHVRTGLLVLGLYGLLTLEFFLDISRRLGADAWGLSPASLLIFGGYTGAVYLLFGIRKPPVEEDLKEAELYGAHSQMGTTALFVFHALAVILAGSLLTRVGKNLAVSTGLGDTFFGSLFFAFVTSMPEFIVSWVALQQLDAVNIAVGNITGSCLFNLAILFPCDLASPGYALLARIQSTHVLSLLGGILMLGLVVFSLWWRRQSPARRAFSAEMPGLAGLYLITMYLLFLVR